MRRIWLKPLVYLGAAWMITGAAAAQDTGAQSSGNWNDPTIWTNGTVPGSSNNVYIGSTYPTGASLSAVITLTQDQQAKNVYLGFGTGTNGTLDLGGNKLTVSGDISIGQATVGNTTGGVGSILESSGGSFQAGSLQVRSGNVATFGANDVAGSLIDAGGSTVTTTATGNVASAVLMAGASTLNLGADLTLTKTAVAGTGQLTATGTGTTINMNGHAINAYAVELGIPPGPGSPSGIPAATLDRGGAGGVLNATGVLISEGTLNLVAGDKIQALEALGNATVTTAASGNVTVDLYVGGGSKVNLGADLLLTGTNSALTASGQLNVQDSGSVLNAQGHAVTADSFLVGQNGTSAVSVTNLGLVTVNTLEVGNGSALTLHGGDTVSNMLSLTGGSTLTVQQTNGMGLTFAGSSASDLTIDPSTMNLVFTSTAPNNWDFRWKDPATGGNWVGTIDSLIGSEITLSLLPGETYQVGDSNGYTYIYGVAGQSVPEPSSLVLAGIATAGVAIAMKRRRRTGR